MKGTFLTILLFSSLLCKAQSGLDSHDKECVVLNNSIFWSYPQDPKIYSIRGTNWEYETKSECEKDFQYQFDAFTYDGEWRGKGWIEVKYKCVPCAQVYADKQKKKAPSAESSKGHNMKTAQGARSCFGENNDSYNDFFHSTRQLPDNIFMDIVSCKDGVIQPRFYNKDANGNKTDVPENERKPINNFYSSMRQRSKERQINQHAKALKNAATQQEVAELGNKIREIFDELQSVKNKNESSRNSNLDEDRQSESPISASGTLPIKTQFETSESEDGATVVTHKTADGVELGSVKVYEDHEEINRVDGSSTHRFDTDNNGLYDKEVQFSPGGDLISDKKIKEYSDHGSGLTPENNGLSHYFPDSKPGSSKEGATRSADSRMKNYQGKPEESTGKEFGFDNKLVSGMAAFASESGNKMLEPLGMTHDGFEKVHKINKTKKLFDNDNPEKQLEGASAALWLAARAAGPAMARNFDNVANQAITNYQTMGAGLDAQMDLLNGKEPDLNQVYRPLMNQLGNTIGFGNLGDDRIAAKAQGDKSWTQLVKEYGFWRGSWKSVLYNSINEMQNQH